MKKLYGTGVALVTPMGADGKIDFKGLERMIRHASKADYMVVMGTTGEPVTLNEEERASVLATVLRVNKRSKPVVYGIGGNNTAGVIAALRAFDPTGVSAILSVSPYYNKPSQEGLYRHYMAIADQSPLPVILYNVPGRTGSNLTADTTIRLSAHPNIIGIKEASGNLEQCMPVTHDGVTVAKGVEIEDKDDETLGYKVGAELIKQAANKMNDVAGDGTTTVTVLTYHILNEANKLIAAGHNPMLLRKGLEQAAHDVISKLSTMSEDIKANKKRVAEVATISAGDSEIGTLISEVIEAVGKEGVVTVEEGQSLSLEKEVVEGFTMDRGFISPYMVTDTTRMEAVYEKPAIIITDKKISSVQEFLPLLEKLA
ncbi:MAG: dihydrodipicolinate synthase family protein, partial [Bacteroidota bacterium]